MIGVKDIQSDLAVDASKLLAMNVANFVTALTVDGDVSPDFSDELVSGRASPTAGPSSIRDCRPVLRGVAR